MRYILSLILVFLINLPNCGMVFASMIEDVSSHMTMSMDMIHGSGGATGDSIVVYSDRPSQACCTGIKVSNDKILGSVAPSPLVILSLFQNITGFSGSHIGESQYRKIGLYNSHAPPNRTAYVHLIGISLKKLH